MSSQPRRSARLSPHLQQDQFHQRTATMRATPSYGHSSQSSSTTTSSYPSPVADNAHPPPPQPGAHQPHLQIQSQFMPQSQHHQQHMYAPLPSPSTGEPQPFFGRSTHAEPNAYGSSQHQPHASFASQQRHQTQQQQQQYGGQVHQAQQMHPHSNSMSQEHPGFAHGAQMPANFVSLEEAAKRAQMACMMRDFGDVSL